MDLAWLKEMLERLRCDSRELSSSEIHNANSQRLRQRLEVREKRIYRFCLIEL